MRHFRTSFTCLYKDFYNELGIGKSSSQDDIKRAYFKLAKQYHPDVNKSTQAKDRFTHISAAYATLGDEKKRRVYDATGLDSDEQRDNPGAASAANTGAGFAGYEGFNE